MTDTKKTQRSWSAEDDAAYLKAQIALGIRKAEKIPASPRDTGVPLPKKERANAGESMEQMSRRLQAERAQKLRESWIDHWYREIDAAYDYYLRVKDRNLTAIAEAGGRG